MSKKEFLPGTVTPIDNTPYHECPEIDADLLAISMKSKNVAEQISNSLRDWGFLILKDHNVPEELINSTIETWRKFFTSPEEIKSKWKYNPLNEIGYVGAGSGSTLSSVPDKKQYAVIKPRHKDFSLPEGEEFKQTVALISALEEVGCQVLDAIEKTCPYSSPYLKDLRKKTTSSPHTIMRVNYFPPSDPSDPEGMVPAAKHTDLGLLTVLVPAKSDCPGLVLWDKTGKKWRVPYVEGGLIINIGDILSISSGGKANFTGRNNKGNGKVNPQGYYPSTLHGVDSVEDRKNDRITIPVFMHLGDKHIISDTKDVNISAEQAMKGALANEQIIDIYRSMKMNGGLTCNTFKDARLGNHGIGKEVEDAKGFDDSDS